MLNASDIKEELEKRKSFLKGGTSTELCNDSTKFMTLDESIEKKHGRRSEAIIESRGKILVTITVHRVVDISNKGANSYKPQHERKRSRVKIAKDIRTKISQELKKQGK